MARTLIMANGHQSRLDIAVPRQMVMVCGQPNIVRTIELMRSTGLDDIVVVAPESQEWSDLCARAQVAQHYLNEDADTLLDTIQKTSWMWTGYRTVNVLLGDVIWSRRRLTELVRADVPVWFSGRTEAAAMLGNAWRRELFGMSMDPNGQHQVRMLLAEASMRTRVHPEIGSAGKLWNLYQEIAGFRQLFADIDDFTWDIDIADDLILLPIIERHIRKEAAS